MKNLKFKTGRGGRFNNQGHVTFIGFEDITDGGTFNEVFPNEDFSIVTNGAGNELDFLINDDGTGFLDNDGEYDTIRVVKEDDLNEKQINAVIEIMEYDYNHEDLERIIKEYYIEYL